MLFKQDQKAVSRVLLFGALAASCAWAQISSSSSRGTSRKSPTPEIGTAIWRGMPVHYVMRNGRAIYQDDIILDNLVSWPDLIPAESPRTLGAIYPGSLWPAVGPTYQIPYIITSGSATLTSAIAQYNATFSGLIQWVPRTTQTDYVNIILDPGNQCGCGESSIGRTGGEQTLNCAINCAVGTLAHEMGHATGLWHEQSRPDRNAYLTLNLNHIQAAGLGNDAIATNNAWIYGPYDFGSVMEYYSFSLSADGSQVIQTIPAGIPLSNSNYYTSADIDTIRRIYSAAPTSVTIDTNPAGLQVIVDGATITTPQAFTWALNSSHTLAIPAGISNSGLQSQAGTYGQLYYQFGKWSDSGAASHTVTVSPGNSMPGYPATSPAETVYTANFIEWVPFSPSPAGSFPPGAGTLTTTPSPTTFTGVGQFFLIDQNVALNANPNMGYNFARWYGSYYCDQGCALSLQGSPLNLNYWTTTNPEPGFTTSQVTTVTTNPPGLTVQVDGTQYTSPATFSPDANISGSTWATGTSHTITALTPLTPWSSNTRYVWSNWSDTKSQSHQITVPSGNSTFTANYNTQVGLVLATNSNNNCAGTLVANPPGPSNTGTPVTFTATPTSGFVFSQWEGALSGSTNPYTGPVNQEQFVQADFNTVSTPLSITSLSPASVAAGAGAFTLTINGTGFTPPPAGNGNTGGYAYVWVNNTYNYRTLTYVSPTQLKIPILAADVASSGVIQILVENIVNGSCWIASGTQFPITQASQFSISGTVTKQSGALSGVAMTLSGTGSGSTNTDSSGNYSFTAAAGGNYTVTPSLTGYTFTPSTQTFDNLAASQSGVNFTTNPALSITSSHTGNFAQGQIGATYTLTVTNGASAGATSGVVTVTETVPSGMTLVSMAGTGWTCPSGGTTCTRSDPLNAGASYLGIMVTVNVWPTAPSSLTNSASVAGGGSLTALGSDPTTVAATIPATSKIGIFRAGMFLLDSNGNSQWSGSPPDAVEFIGQSGDVAIVGDWNGDGRSKIGIFRNGLWVLDYNGNGQWDGPPTDRFINLGQPGDIPVVGDWNGDGRTKVGVFRNGFWILDYNGNGQWDGPPLDRVIGFGQAGDIPVVGDWNGTGFAKAGIFRNGQWILDYNGNGVWDGTPGDRVINLGQAGDIPVIGDWNGTGFTKAGIFRNGLWVLDYNGNGAWDGSPTDRIISLGQTGDVPVVGDWNGTGFAKAGIFRNGLWVLDNNGDGAWNGAPPDVVGGLGQSGDTPLVGRW